MSTFSTSWLAAAKKDAFIALESFSSAISSSLLPRRSAGVGGAQVSLIEKHQSGLDMACEGGPRVALDNL